MIGFSGAMWIILAFIFCMVALLSGYVVAEMVKAYLS